MKRRSPGPGAALGAALAAALVATAPPAAAYDREAAGREGLALLRELIRIDTSNPPGNELALLRVAADRLKPAGIEAEIAETEPGRGVLRAVLPATQKGAAAARGPILVVAHVDVVGANRTEWTADPFAAEDREGALYGRGAIDDKGMAAAAITSLVTLSRAGGERSRDLVLILTGDEESGGRLGTAWIVKNRPGWFQRPAEAINEGGRVLAGDDGRPRWIGLQTTEKISFNLEILAHGKPGHASMPDADNAILRLGKALARLEGYRPLPRTTDETKAFFRGLAAVSSPDAAEHLRAIVDLVQEKVRAGGPALAPKYETRIVEGPHVSAVSKDRMFSAMLRDTFAPTLLSGGMRTNVLPAEAKATLNCRILPDTTPAAFVEELRRVVDDPALEWNIVTEPKAPPPASPLQGPLPDAIAAAAKALWPDAPVLPFLSTGATDSATIRREGIPSYGLLPFPLSSGDLERMHGADERVPHAAYIAGQEFLYRALEEAIRPAP